MDAANNSAGTPVNRNVRSRIMVCYGLCAIAHTEVEAGQLERATDTLAALQNKLQEINLLTSDDSMTSSIRDMREMLSELDRAAWRISRQICRGQC
jgi:hypothetical protein